MAANKGIAAIVVIIAISVTAAIIGIVSEKYLGENNEIEKLSEEVIEHETGIKVDLDLDPKKSDSK